MEIITTTRGAAVAKAMGKNGRKFWKDTMRDSF
jgi:hypothetical protein